MGRLYWRDVGLVFAPLCITSSTANGRRHPAKEVDAWTD